MCEREVLDGKQEAHLFFENESMGLEESKFT